MAISGGALFVGGTFTNIGGQTRNRIAALDAASGTATSWNPNANGTVRAIQPAGYGVYAGGSFTSIGGLARSYLAVPLLRGAAPVEPLEQLRHDVGVDARTAVDNRDLSDAVVGRGDDADRFGPVLQSVADQVPHHALDVRGVGADSDISDHVHRHYSLFRDRGCDQFEQRLQLDNLGVDLEVDKQYRYVVFSTLKKNYLGVMPDGNVDVKGLTGKKSHTPPFLRNAFYEILEILGKVNSQKDFETARESIKNIIQRDAKNLESHAIPMQDLSFNVMINKSLSSYGKKVNSTKTMDGKETQVETFKGLPQHIKAAKLLADKGRDIKAGDIISYVKTKTGDGVKPVELAKADEIDVDKYLETMESTLDQVLSVLNFDFKSMLGKPRQQSLDELFWSKPPPM